MHHMLLLAVCLTTFGLASGAATPPNVVLAVVDDRTCSFIHDFNSSFQSPLPFWPAAPLANISSHNLLRVPCFGTTPSSYTRLGVAVGWNDVGWYVYIHAFNFDHYYLCIYIPLALSLAARMIEVTYLQPNPHRTQTNEHTLVCSPSRQNPLFFRKVAEGNKTFPQMTHNY